MSHRAHILFLLQPSPLLLFVDHPLSIDASQPVIHHFQNVAEDAAARHAVRIRIKRSPVHQRIVEQRLQHADKQVVVFSHASKRQFAGASESAFDSAHAEHIDQIGGQSERNALPIQHTAQTHFWDLQNGSLLEDAVEIDVRHRPVALHQNVVLVPIAQSDHLTVKRTHTHQIKDI